MERNTALKIDGLSQRFATQRGAALFLAIFALAAIGFVSLRLVSGATAYSQLLRIHRDGLAHHAALRESIQPISSHQRRCEAQYLSGRSIAGVDSPQSQWYVCTTGQPTFRSNHDAPLPSINPDYGAIFASGVICPFARSMTTLRVFDAPAAPFTCLLPVTIQGDTIILDNITADSTSLHPRASARTVTIATPGSFMASASLSVAGNTLLIAGGNVSISVLRLLETPTAAPICTVTVLSAHGDIIIERIEGALSLLALGRRAISVPEANAPASPLLPPVRAPSISGVVPGES